MDRIEVAGDPQEPLALPLDQARAGPAEERREIGMRERVSKDQIGVEMGRILRLVLREGDDDVGMSALRLYVLLGVGLPGIELGQHLVRRVSPPRAVALQ